jgi:WD40 repeat protein
MRSHGGDRFLLTAVVSQYSHNSDLDRPELIHDVARLSDLLTRDFGYTHVPVCVGSPTFAELRDGLRRFCRAPERRQDDLVAVYLACHGDVLDRNDFVLMPADIDPDDPVPLAITPQALVGWLLRDTKIRRLLLILDTCYSGLGGQEVAQAAVRWVNQPGTVDRAGVVLVTATHPWQVAQPGVFSSAFKRAITHLASGGHAQEDLPLDAVVGVINADPDKAASQTVACHQLGLAGLPPPFLLNPRYRQPLMGVDLLEQERAHHAEQRAGHLRDRFLPATRWFTGRHAAINDIMRWLHEPSETRPALVVTGNAGSGKTALLGLLAALSDSDYGPSIPRDGLPSGLNTCENIITDVIYAGTMTTGQVRDRIAIAAGLRAETTGELIDGLRHSEDNALLILIDALDEAADPPGLVSGLLVPLIRNCPGKLRLLLGTRPYLLTPALLGRPGDGRYLPVDLDSEYYADSPSIHDYIRRILLSADALDSAYKPSGIYSATPAAILEEITEAIREAAGKSFLVARITATTEATVFRLPDPTDRAWREALPRHAGEAMRRDLRLRLKENADRAARLLLPLAYAQGGGLPWENIWPSLVNALSPGRGYGNEQLIWLRRAAGSYAVESLVNGRSAYRLYHQALAEHLLETRDQEADQQIIVKTLASLVRPTSRNNRDWAVAHPYIQAHLATHAARAGDIDSLLTDPGYLLAASPPQLLAAASVARTAPARAAADAYRRAAHHLRVAPPAEHASYLQLSARCGRAPRLADALDQFRQRDRWSSRWASWRFTVLNRTLTGHTGNVRSVAAGELDGRPVVISGGDDAMVQLWDLAAGRPLGDPFVGHTGCVRSAVIGELGGRPVAISGGDDQTVRVWDLATGRPVGSPLTGHTDYVRSVALGELHGRLVVISGSNDQTVLVWDLATGRPVGSPLTGHTSYVRSVAVGELDGRPVVISGSSDKTVRVWDLDTSSSVGDPFIGHTAAVTSLAVGQLHGRPIVISGSNDQTVRVWDLSTGKSIGTPLIGHTGWVLSVTAGQLDGRPVAISGSDDGTVRVWDLAAGVLVDGPLTGHTSYVNSVAVAEFYGRSVVISGSPDKTVRIWDLDSGALVNDPLTGRSSDVQSAGDPFVGHSSSVNSVAIGELDGRPVVVSGSSDTTVRVWDLATGAPVGEPYAGHVGAVRSVAIGELEGQPLVVSGGDDGVRVWDLATGAPVGDPFAGQTGSVNSVAIGGLKGRPVAVSGSSDGTVRAWYLATGTMLAEPFTGHSDAVNSVAIAELEGRAVVVSGSSDKTVRVWDLSLQLPVRRHLRTIRLRHVSRILTVIIRPHYRSFHIFTGCADGVSRMWSLPGCRLLWQTDVSGRGGIGAITALTSEHVLCANGSTISLRELNNRTNPSYTIDLGAEILAMAVHGTATVVIGTNLGLAVLDIPLLRSLLVKKSYFGHRDDVRSWRNPSGVTQYEQRRFWDVSGLGIERRFGAPPTGFEPAHSGLEAACVCKLLGCACFE